MSGMTRHNHRSPRIPDSKYLNTGSCPITACCSNSTTGTRIIGMTALTPDKHTLVKVDFPIRDTVYQGLGRSTPRQMTRPGAFTTPPPLGKVDWSSTSPCSAMGWNITYHKALYLCLSATVHVILDFVKKNKYTLHVCSGSFISHTQRQSVHR
jgi:hypothetical protein